MLINSKNFEVVRNFNISTDIFLRKFSWNGFGHSELTSQYIHTVEANIENVIKILTSDIVNHDSDC